MTDAEFDELVEHIKENRKEWMRCKEGCVECGGYGWDVFEIENSRVYPHGIGIMANDTCSGKSTGMADDDQAHASAAEYLRVARQLIEGLASGQMTEIQVLICAVAMSPDPDADVKEVHS